MSKKYKIPKGSSRPVSGFNASGSRPLSGVSQAFSSTTAPFLQTMNSLESFNKSMASQSLNFSTASNLGVRARSSASSHLNSPTRKLKSEDSKTAIGLIPNHTVTLKPADTFNSKSFSKSWVDLNSNLKPTSRRNYEELTVQNEYLTNQIASLPEVQKTDPYGLENSIRQNKAIFDREFSGGEQTQEARVAALTSRMDQMISASHADIDMMLQPEWQPRKRSSNRNSTGFRTNMGMGASMSATNMSNMSSTNMSNMSATNMSNMSATNMSNLNSNRYMKSISSKKIDVNLSKQRNLMK